MRTGKSGLLIRYKGKARVYMDNCHWFRLIGRERLKFIIFTSDTGLEQLMKRRRNLKYDCI